MPDILQKISNYAVNPDLFLWGMAIIYLTGLVLLAAVAAKFWQHYKNPQNLFLEKSHFFSTREMTICVLALFPFWVNSWGQFTPNLITQYIYFGTGLIMVIFAIVWHIQAKFNIGFMWSDAIEIKEKHSLITGGAYALARHPMYASLLMWCWGCSLMMFNWITLAAVSFIFLPLVIMRAKDEEKALIAKNKDYQLYQNNVRMLTLTLSGMAALVIKILAISLLTYFIISGISLPALCLLVFIHLYLGYSLLPEKVAFSYRSKSGMMIVFGLLGLYVWQPFFYMFYLFLAMFIYGLKWNCPCMIVYNKYQRCPCFMLLGKCTIKRK